MYPRRHTREGFGLMLLAYQIFNVGIDSIPPVTLATIAAQVSLMCELFLGSKRDVYNI